MTTSPTVEPLGDYILILACFDRPGIVHAVSSFLVEHGGNIRESQQFGDGAVAIRGRASTTMLCPSPVRQKGRRSPHARGLRGANP